MRQGQNAKRSRGRGSGRRSNVPTRHQTFDSNGPSVRIRGSAFQVHEKYLALARDAAASGDRIMAENYLQHAEHYFRIINTDNDGDSRNRGQRAERHQQDRQSTGGEDTGDSAAAEQWSPSSGNGHDRDDPAEDTAQPPAAPANGEDREAGAAEDTAPVQKKPRAARTPRGTGRGRPRSSRTAGNSAEETQPSQPEE